MAQVENFHSLASKAIALASRPPAQNASVRNCHILNPAMSSTALQLLFVSPEALHAIADSLGVIPLLHPLCPKVDSSFDDCPPLVPIDAVDLRERF